MGEKESSMTEELVELLEGTGAKVVDVTPKKEMKISISATGMAMEELKKIIFNDGGNPICCFCGKNLKQEKGGLWGCVNPNCNLSKDIKVSIG